MKEPKPARVPAMNFWHPRSREKRIATKISTHLSKGDRILDFGCGEMLIAKKLMEMTGAEIIGVDIIDNNKTDLPLSIYDGNTLPFQNKSFDATVACFTLHHTDDPEKALSECVRVTKKRLIIIEDVYRFWPGKMILCLFDLINKFVSKEMNIPFNFKTEKGWLKTLSKISHTKLTSVPIRPVLLQPTRHRMFVLDLEQ